MIGLGPPGRVRPWQLAAAVTKARRVFPKAKVFVDPNAVVVDLSGPVTEEIMSWSPTALRIAVQLLASCRDDDAIARVIEKAASRVTRGVVVDVGIDTDSARAVAEPTPARRGPRLGRRVDPEDLRPRLRGVVIR